MTVLTGNGRLQFRPEGSDKWIDIGEVRDVTFEVDRGVVEFHARLSSADVTFLRKIHIAINKRPAVYGERRMFGPSKTP